MASQQWYLIAYDIADARRLQRVHRFLRTRAWMLQKSVYLCRLDRAGLEDIRRGLRKLTDPAADDIRAYAVQPPGRHWTSGRQEKALSGAYGSGVAESNHGLIEKFIERLKRKKRGTDNATGHRSQQQQR